MNIDNEYLVYKVIGANIPIQHLCVQAENRKGDRVCFAVPRIDSPSNKENLSTGIQEGDIVLSSWIQAYSCAFISECEYRGIDPQPFLDNYKLIEKKANEMAHSWVKSDDFQYIKHIAYGAYNCIEARPVDFGTDNYLLCQSVVNIYDYMNADGSYDEDGIEIIKTYYDKVEDFNYEDKDFKNQVFAEMVFEETSYSDCDNFRMLTASEDILTAIMEAYTQGTSFQDAIKLADTVEERDY